MEVYTDASGTEGFAIYFNGQWVSTPWPDSVKHKSIQWKELFPIYVACLIWAPNFCNKRLEFHCDNQAVISVWASHTYKSPEVMSPLPKMFYILALFNVTINIRLIRDTDNTTTDSLSCLQIACFRSLAPAAKPMQASILPKAWEL